MIEKLNQVIKNDLSNWLSDIREWDSLVINKRVPHTNRIFRMLPDGSRLCLHRFEYFDKSGGEEAFMHPHPWPGAFKIVAGEYDMSVGYTKDRFETKPTIIYNTRLASYSMYEITDPLVWHSVTPVTKTVYTVMLNDKPWDKEVAHTQVRTTKGKDLEKMDRKSLIKHLCFFNFTLFRNFLWECDNSPTGFCVSMKTRYDNDCLYCCNSMDERK